MKHLLTNTLGLAAAALLSASAHAVQSSKFAAHVSQAGSGLHLLHSGVADTSVSNPHAVDDTANILTSTIRTANNKDLLIGVSLQNGLYTDTQVKGKNGSSEQADAMAAIKVSVNISGYDSTGAPATAYPSEVVFAARVQELSAVLGGVIESCSDGNIDGTIIVGDECTVSDEAIGLILSTTSANHFNFVAPDLAPGDHSVTVTATALSSAEFTNGTYTMSMTEEDCLAAGGVFADGQCTFSTTDNEAKAWALVDVGSLTVEQVRAVNQEGGIVIDLDAGY